MIYFRSFIVLFFCLTLGCRSQPITGEIVSKEHHSNGGGYTTIRVWGSYYEMGYAQGALLASDIKKMVDKSIRVLGPGRYSYIRSTTPCHVSSLLCRILFTLFSMKGFMVF